MTRVFKNRILALLLLAIATYAIGQIAPGTKVIRFKFPLFNEEGYRTWYMRGEEGTYISESQIRIGDMRVSQYTGDDEDKRIAVLTSSEAVFHIDSTTAYGPGELKIETDAFEVSGTDWIWLGEKKEITLNKDVRVILYHGIGDILK